MCAGLLKHIKTLAPRRGAFKIKMKNVRQKVVLFVSGLVQGLTQPPEEVRRR